MSSFANTVESKMQNGDFQGIDTLKDQNGALERLSALLSFSPALLSFNLNDILLCNVHLDRKPKTHL